MKGKVKMKRRFNGLSAEEVLQSRSKHGDNELKRQKTKGFFGKYLENLSDPIIRILLIALFLQVVFSFGNVNYIEVCGILFAIILSTTVSTLSERRSELAFEKLSQSELSELSSVERDGKIVKIPIGEIVVGDVIYLSAGERVPADGILLDGRITVDQSALNGESVECTKTVKKPRGFELSEEGRVFRGSVIMSGSCVIRCERVGENSYYGGVAKDIQTEPRVSPLKLRLSKLAADISRIGYLIAALVGLAFLFNAFVVDNGFCGERILSSFKDLPFVFETLLRALTLMITVVVVAAPEGLPMMITVVLSANMKKMLSDRILVKKPVGIETAGSLNILFTDKTGTVTVGKPECSLIITSVGSFKTEAALSKKRELYELLLLNAKYNTDVTELSGELSGGNATDRGIYSYFKSTPPDRRVASKSPFSSDTKCSKVSFSDGITINKGAPEYLLGGIRRAVGEGGELVNFDYSEIYKEYTEAMRRGERVIAVSCSFGKDSEEVFVALIVMKDKIRKGAPDAVRELTRAGIQVVMITGDAKETASAIAKEAGIYNPASSQIALDAKELHAMTDEQIKEIIPKLRVVARALPSDKTRLVRLSQELDLVVGMTGDGINDAPSLKLSDVGFSMGSGTEVAKGASDIVILDNSLSAIDKTVLYGRTIFKSIRKFITFQLIMNFCASGVSLLGQFIGIDTPITIIQMLWINIIMDTLGGLAFAGEPPLNYYMREKPKRRDEPILSKEMLRSIVLSGAFTLFLCGGFLASGLFRGLYTDDLSFYTAFYALFIFAGIFNCFAARSDRLNLLSNIGKNKLFVLIMTLISTIQIFMIYYGGNIFRCIPLSAKELSFVIFLAFTVIPFDIIRRIVYKLK